MGASPPAGPLPLLGASRRIAEGEPADFLLVRTDAPELALGDFVAGLVYAASGSVVDTTVVNGRVLMRGGVVEGVDEVVAQARERCTRLGLRRSLVRPAGAHLRPVGGRRDAPVGGRGRGYPPTPAQPGRSAARPSAASR